MPDYIFAFLLPHPLAQASPSAASDAPESLVIFQNYTNANFVNALALDGNYLWSGKDGGAVRWDTVSGSYVKYTRREGLVTNWVQGVTSCQGSLWFGALNGGVSKLNGTAWTTYSTSNSGLWAIPSNRWRWMQPAACGSAPSRA